MTDLETRLREASGPDRDLDAAIAVATTPTKSTDNDLIYAKLRDPGNDATSPGHYFIQSRSGASARTSPEYTRSVDDALTLLSDGMQCVKIEAWLAVSTWGYRAEIFAPVKDLQSVLGTSGAYYEPMVATRAIAICIAVLKARDLIARTSSEKPNASD